MQLALATKLKGVVITSSPGFTPAASSARCKPLVPELTPIPCRLPAKVVQERSKASTFGPIESVEECRTSLTASISTLVISGWERGMGGGMGDQDRRTRGLAPCGKGRQPATIR